MTYGYCPNCGSEGKARERSPNGKTFCKKGHAFLSVKWEEFNKSYNHIPKRKGWCINGMGFIDFAVPVTYEEAKKEMEPIFERFKKEFPCEKQTGETTDGSN